MTQAQIRATAAQAKRDIARAAELLQEARARKAPSWDPAPLTPARRLRTAVSAREAAEEAIRYCMSIAKAAREVERQSERVARAED